MKRELALLDRQVFERAASLFASKREALPPEAVEAVASDTVRRLAQLPQVARSFEVPDIDEAQIKAFCNLLMKPDPDADLRFLEDRSAEGLSREAVSLATFPGARAALANVGTGTSCPFSRSPAEQDISVP